MSRGYDSRRCYQILHKRDVVRADDHFPGGEPGSWGEPGAEVYVSIVTNDY